MAIVWEVIFMVWFEKEKKKKKKKKRKEKKTSTKTTNTNTTRRHCGYDYRSIWSTWDGKEYMGLIDVLDVRCAWNEHVDDIFDYYYNYRRGGG